MKQLVTLAIACVWSFAAWGGTVESGPPITAAQLAQQMKVFTYSLTYKQERPFTALSFALTYKERKSDGSYELTKELVVRTAPLPLPHKEISLAVLVGDERSTVSSGSFSSGGKGVEIGGVFSTQIPPPLRPGGGYVLLRVSLDPHLANSEENTKGILELEIKPIE